MTPLSRQEVLDVLQQEWGTYVQRYRSMSPTDQVDFVSKQGYRRFADLLAHITDWWQIGRITVENYIDDPAFVPTHFDVDAFNFAAVTRVRRKSEQEVIDSFERTRAFLVEFVSALPEAAFENEKVVRQLYMDIIGHLGEHSMPDRH